MMAELEKAWAGIEILLESLDRADMNFNDACAACDRAEQQQRAEREWWVTSLMKIKEECLGLESACRAERAGRVGELNHTRSLAARLRGGTDELLLRGREVAATRQMMSQVRGDEHQLGQR